MFLFLINNLALILVMLVAYEYFRVRIKQHFSSEIAFQALSGILFGIVCILSMSYAYQVSPGIFYDGRTIVMGIAGVFGGPIAAGIAFLMGAAFRFWRGGQGAAWGIVTLFFSSGLALMYRRLVSRKKIRLDMVSLAVLALLIHLAQIAFNLMLQSRIGMDLFRAIAPTVLLLLPLMFLLIARIFIYMQKSQSDQEKLNASELRYRTLFQDNTAMMLLVDPVSGTITDANRAASTFYGFSIESMRGMHITQLNSLSPGEARELLGRMLSAGHGYLAMKHRNAAGELREVEVYSARIQFGEQELLHEIVHDVTEREHAFTERLMLYDAMDASYNEIYIFDPETLLFSYVSRGALKNLGYTMEEMRRLTPLDLKKDIPADEFMRIINQLKSGEKQDIVFRTTHTRANGSKYPVEIRLHLHDANGNRIFLAVIEDMTEYQRAMDEITSQLDELKRWHKVTLNREERIIELKQEVNELCRSSGLAERYRSEASRGTDHV